MARLLLDIETTCSQELVERFVQFSCEQLNITPKQITVRGVDTLEGTNGFCYDETEDKFLIVVAEENRNLGQIFGTLAHEMVHVKQYMNQNLGYLLDHCQEIPYMERWWEKEAINMTGVLVKNFVKHINNS